MRSPSKPPAAGTRDRASPRADDNSPRFSSNIRLKCGKSTEPMTGPLWEETLPLARILHPHEPPCPQRASVSPALAPPSARIAVVMSDLAAKTCVPCRGGMPPLKGEELGSLQMQVDGWNVIEEHHITKAFQFLDFREALKFVNRVGELAEEQRHHPDIFLGWGKVEITTWTHKINGLTESDFILAAKIDQRYKP